MIVANQFTGEVNNTTSTGLLLAQNLAFAASYWRIDNLGTVPVRFSLVSTGGDTGSYEIRAGESRELNDPVSSNKFSLATTSTSTEDHRRVRVLALGD